MLNLKEKIGAYVSQWREQRRRRKHRVKLEVRTRDDRNVVRDYTIVAVPRTLDKAEYDVRIKRVALGGCNTEILERVWTREHLEQVVHASA